MSRARINISEYTGEAFMRISNGKIIILTGILHTVFGISPIAFGKQFYGFAQQYFFKISDGFFELPIFNRLPNYENGTAFWFFYFGLLLIPLGLLLDSLEKNNYSIPKQFILSYLFVVLVGVYMFPFSGMTVFMLPHAIYLTINYFKKN